MNIFDQDKLIQDYDLVHRVIELHPFGQELKKNIDTLYIKKIESGPSINYERKKRICTLNISGYNYDSVYFEYILYHEFSHVADRLAYTFGYSDNKNNLLSESEQICLMELWNVYIDSRLNYHQLFKLGENDRDIHCMINGKLQKAPYSIKGKIQRHISFLESRGVKKAKSIVIGIWDNPKKYYSYDNLISLIKENDG